MEKCDCTCDLSRCQKEAQPQRTPGQGDLRPRYFHASSHKHGGVRGPHEQGVDTNPTRKQTRPSLSVATKAVCYSSSM